MDKLAIALPDKPGRQIPSGNGATPCMVSTTVFVDMSIDASPRPCGPTKHTSLELLAGVTSITQGPAADYPLGQSCPNSMREINFLLFILISRMHSGHAPR